VVEVIGRVLRNGLSSLRDRASKAVSPLNPSRRQRIVAVGIGCFVVGAILGAQGHTAFSLFEFALAAVCVWQLYKEADEG
jgi:uncharacterized membrane protein YoaK (UPF0700 family)